MDSDFLITKRYVNSLHCPKLGEDVPSFYIVGKRLVSTPFKIHLVGFLFIMVNNIRRSNCVSKDATASSLWRSSSYSSTGTTATTTMGHTDNFDEILSNNIDYF